MKYIHSSKVYCAFILFVLMGLISGCGLFKPSVTDAFMTKLGQTEPKYAPEDTFSTYDFPYIFIKLKNATEKITVRTVLTNLNSDEVLIDDEYYYDNTDLVDGYFVIQFISFTGKHFPGGKYQVDIYLDKEFEKSINFKIQ